MAVLTTAGTAKYNAVIANGGKILIKKLVFGSNTGAVSAATTDIGTPVYSFDRVHLSTGFSTTKISFSVYLELPAVAMFSQVGIYDDTNTLIAVERVNVVSTAPDNGWKLFALVLNATRPDVFDSMPTIPGYMASTKNSVKLQKQALDFFTKSAPSALDGQIYKYHQAVPTVDWLMAQANIVETTAELDLAKNSIPSMEEMFNTWYRFSHNATGNYPATAAELNGWALTADKKVTTTINSSTFIGLVSPDKYINYEIDTQISSTSADDDTGGIVLAFNKEDKEYSLSAVRCLGGNALGWRLIFNHTQSSATVVSNKTNTVKFSDNILHTSNDFPPHAVTPAYVQNGGWSRADLALGTRVKVTRNGDIITAQCSDFGSTALLPNTLMTVNLADYPALAPLRKPASYGYCSFSQPNTFWNTTKFIDKDNAILDIRDGKIYSFDGTNWVVVNQNVKETFGVNKFLYSRVNKKSFFIDGNGVLKRVM